MAIRRDIPIDMTASEVMKALSHGERDTSWMATPARDALDRALDLLDPVVVYDWVEVRGVEGETVRVRTGNARGETHLHLGPHANLMEAARTALVSVNSIGQRLDDAVSDLNRKGDALAAYLLDCVGVVALSKVSDAASRMAEAKAETEGWGVGDRLSPGSLAGWDTAGQFEICGLLPLKAASISLTGSGLILPFKSASGMIGLGPGFKNKTVGSVCRLCSLKENCWRRKY